MAAEIHDPHPGGLARVVIVGAGFAGLAAVRELGDAPVRTLVIDQHNHHVFTPFLYQIASALLEPVEVAQPVRSVLRGVPNVDVRLGTVTAIDFDARRVHTDRGDLDYDYLVLAAGSVNNYYGNPKIAHHSLGLNDVGEALRLRNGILEALEHAAWERDPDRRRRLLTFAVVGAGPTGVEFAAALATLIRGVAGRDYRWLNTDAVRIVLVQGDDAPLPSFRPRLRAATARALARKGVETLTNLASDVSEEGLVLDDGQVVEAATVVWAAGVHASPLAGETGLQLGSQGRIKVDGTLRPTGRPEVFVTGDLAEMRGRDGEPLPMLAQVAIQSGRHAGKSIKRLLDGDVPTSFHYHDLGTMATVGRNAGVAQIGPLSLSGFIGWLAWLLVHIARIAGLQTRMSVVLRWVWGYLLLDRPVRLIVAPRRPDQPAEEDRDSPDAAHRANGAGA